MKKSYKILVIDDDPDILDAICSILESYDYIVISSLKGEYAENLTNKSADLPDLIILDVLLSGKDGRTICKKLKSQKETGLIPIIMISAHPGAEISVKEVGADHFLAKPFELSELIDKVQSSLT